MDPKPVKQNKIKYKKKAIIIPVIKPNTNIIIAKPSGEQPDIIYKVNNPSNRINQSNSHMEQPYEMLYAAVIWTRFC